MNVNTTNSYSTSAATNKGMSGMISGMDTEAMVEQMLSGTQGKIDKQEQEKQKIIWQQLKYREIIADLNKFQDTFFGSTSATNLSSIDFFNSMSVNSASKAFSAIASSDAAIGNTTVRVGQLATASSIKSGSKVSGGLFGTPDDKAFERKVTFTIGGNNTEVDLSNITGDTDEEKLNNLIAKLNTDLGGKGVSASKDENGKLKLTGKFSISAKSSALGMEMLGVTAGQKSTDSLTTTAKPDAKVSLDISLNGIKRTISLDDSAKNNIAGKLQEEINSTFGKGWIEVGNTGDGRISINTKGSGNSLVVSGNQSGLNLLGLESGQSDKIARGQMLKDTNFITALQGDKFEFTINGEKFEFTGDSTINDVIKTVNARSKAGVRITYSDLEDKFTIEASETGAGRDITMSQQSGNLLNAMFGNVDGMTTSNTVVSKELLTDTFTGKDTSGYGDSFEGGYFTFKVDGKSYSISIPSGETTSREQVTNLINEGLANRFGYDAAGNQNIELKKNANNTYTMEVRNGSKVTFEDVELPDDADKKKEAIAKNVHIAFGFNGASNINKDENSQEVQDMKTALGNKFGSANVELEKVEGKFTGKFIVKGSGKEVEFTSPADDNLKKLFGTKSVSLGVASGAKATEVKGQNAIAEINGITIERSTNTFEANGMTISLNDVTESIPTLNKVEIWKGNGSGKEYTWKNGQVYDQSGNIMEGYSVKGNNLMKGDTVIGGITKQSQHWLDQSGNKYTQDNDGKVSITDKNGQAVDTYKGMDISIKADDSGNGFHIIDNSTGNFAFTTKAETVTTSRNTDKIVDGLKSFVEKYNEMIDKLNTLIHEDATYRDYPPLTSAQKKEMSDKEIELWEEKAQEGLYRNDSDISSFLQNMRTALYSKPEGAEYALYDIGIESSSEWRDYGKLEFNESKVRSMVEANPQAVQELFTNATDGLAALMNKELKRTANTSSGSAGTLVEKAGVQGKATAITNQMTQRLISINEKIDELKKKYETEKNRYWKQFNSMETALSNMNTQSSWLAMQFSY